MLEGEEDARVDLVGSRALKAATGELREGKLHERGPSLHFLPGVRTSYGTPLRSGRLLSIRAKQVKTTWFLAWFSAVADALVTFVQFTLPKFAPQQASLERCTTTRSAHLPRSSIFRSFHR